MVDGELGIVNKSVKCEYALNNFS